MPSAGCAADISSDVCCDTWYLIGERIRTVAFAGVCTCIEPGCGDREFISHQTEGDIYSILGDSLAITFVRAGITQPRPGGRVGPTPMTTLTYRLELRENGWPLPATADDQRQVLVAADWQMLHALSAHARGHAEKMWRSVAHAAATTMPADRMFSPSLHPFIMEGRIGVGDITPLPNLGPQVGYQMVVTVDIQLKPVG